MTKLYTYSFLIPILLCKIWFCLFIYLWWMQLHYCSCLVRTALEVRDLLGKSHSKQVPVSVAEKWSCQGLVAPALVWDREQSSFRNRDRHSCYPPQDTKPHILQRKCSLNSYCVGVSLALGILHHYTIHKCEPRAHYLNPKVRVQLCDTAKRDTLGSPWPPRLAPLMANNIAVRL